RVREAYGKIAQSQKGCGCCGEGETDTRAFARALGYSDEELHVIPDEANLALSCGNPTAVASLHDGEVVLDLGSGAGFDCFLAASQVGARGRVIGVDMTPEMVEKARTLARQHGVRNVEFRLGEIEHLPIADDSIDVAISNCVINLSVDKPQVFRELYRVLKPGGRIAISDIALLKELPASIRSSLEAYVGCVGGAVLVDEYRRFVEAAGFQDVTVTVKQTSSCVDPHTDDPIGRTIVEGVGTETSLQASVVSIDVTALK
ncbi:MAG: arsenite methyltransferase, partial [Candidatus Latescibacteria bacterium]|nr:arsenite methyltransferase [Candidatus Latescibacterota bacterium]